MSIAILTLAIVRQDGMALLAVLLLSILSTIIGIGSRWSLELRKRNSTREVPVSDVVICYPQGAFMIVKCDEDVARELYWHPERCIYHVGATAYRLISLTATLLLMFAVISLSNAELILQLAFAASYMILNAAYWTAAALPQRWNWDLSRFHVEPIRFVAGRGAHGSKGDGNFENFTPALWTAIAITRSIEWVHNGNIAPRSTAWSQWLEKAEEMARTGKSLAGTPQSGVTLRGEMDGRRKMEMVRTGTTEMEKGKLETGVLADVMVLPAWDCDAALTAFLNPEEAVKRL